MLDLWPLSGSNDLHRSLRKASTQQSIEVPDRILNNKRRETSGDIGITSGKDTIFAKKLVFMSGFCHCGYFFGTFFHFLATFSQGSPAFRFLAINDPIFTIKATFKHAQTTISPITTLSPLTWFSYNTIFYLTRLFQYQKAVLTITT